EIEFDEAAELPAPAGAKDRIAEQEGHVDADGGGGRGHDDSPLVADNDVAPVTGKLGWDVGQHGLERIGWPEDHCGVRNEAAQRFSPVQSARLEREADHDADKSE